MSHVDTTSGRGWIIAALLLGCTVARGDDTSPQPRTPQWPLKTSRALQTDEQIRRARELCDTVPAATQLRKRIVARTDYWIDISDQALRDRLPDGRVSRAFNVSSEGCPEHGKAIYKHGTYPWKLDRDRPFTVTCPVGGETYPSNDFDAYYRSGFTDKRHLAGPHADPGRGWVAPDGEKYWLVGYACHWNWLNHWIPAVTALSQAYLVTGDRTYARKAIVMLDRIAEIYPGMDYSKQSRYAERMNGQYYGKIVNAIWETNIYRETAIAYDGVFDALIGDDAISLPWRSAEAIRANIEANLLEEGFDAIDRLEIAGNFGMHQSALTYGAVVRQHGPIRELLDAIFTNTGGPTRQEGLNYALYNLVFKDGMPYETAPGYCFSWVDNFVRMSESLALADIDLYARPKFRLIFDAPLRMICTGAFTPAIGDAGGISAGWIGTNATAYTSAFRRYEAPTFAWALDHFGALDDDSIRTIDDLFRPSIVAKAKSAAESYHHQPTSRVLDGYGLAVLNNARDNVAVSMYYGIRGGHGHFDRLTLELFARGRRLTPDLGYPDFMNAFVPGIFSWSKNTISHNTLTVDEMPQNRNRHGRVLRFCDSPTVDVVDVDGQGSYDPTDVYRRTLVLVETGENDAYLVDVFRVRGGAKHVLSLHGQEGAFTLYGADLSPPVSEGTLAGADVEYGALYDDPKLSVPGYKGSYGGYKGSGYSHFFNWQRAAPEEIVTGQWTLAGEPAASLRAHVLPHPGQELIVADAYVSPTQKEPTVLKYMLARRSTAEAGNTFAVVWEPYADKPQIDRIKVHHAPSDGHADRVAFKVLRGDTADTVLVADAPGTSRAVDPAFETDAAVAVTSVRDGRVIRAFATGGTRLASQTADDPIRIPVTITGLIQQVDYNQRRITVNTSVSESDAASLVGQTVRIANEHHASVYRIAGAGVSDETLTLDLTGSDVFTGRIKLGKVDPQAKTVATKTKVLYPFDLDGMTLVTEDLRHQARIRSMDNGVIRLTEDEDAKPFTTEGKDAWIADFGFGDSATIERSIHRHDP